MNKRNIIDIYKSSISNTVNHISLLANPYNIIFRIYSYSNTLQYTIQTTKNSYKLDLSRKFSLEIDKIITISKCKNNYYIYKVHTHKKYCKYFNLYDSFHSDRKEFSGNILSTIYCDKFIYEFDFDNW